MQHLTEEQLVLHHYHDDDAPAAAEQHLGSCDACRSDYDNLRKVLTLVDEMPLPERDHSYGEQVWTRLRWKLDKQRQRTMRWQSMLATAAVLALVFFAGQLWNARRGAVRIPPASAGRIAGATQSTAMQPSRDRLLLVVVTDHLDNSERMLLEVANADASRSLDLSSEHKRAQELVASNRIYRQTATQQGDTRIATLLSDLEPVLLELARSADTMSPDDVATLQKRIESKGLLFKVRVVSAQTGGREAPAVQKGTNSL